MSRARLAVLLCLLVVGCDGGDRRRRPARSERAGKTADVVVVGGGIAGLLTAHRLERAGVRVHLLEATELWGGRIATAYYGPGLAAEYGMQEIWEGNPL